MLISNNVKPHNSCTDGRTPLHDASERGNIDIVRLILDTEPDVNAENWQKITPLHLAASYGRIEVVQLLLERGANIDAQDSNGMTPLHRAAFQNHSEIVQFLISSGCDHQLLNNDGLKASEIAPEPLKFDITDFMINNMMTPKKSAEYLKTTPGLCVFCQSNVPVYVFEPCLHMKVCDTCYINNKEILKKCPMCGKALKRVAVIDK